MPARVASLLLLTVLGLGALAAPAHATSPLSARARSAYRALLAGDLERAVRESDLAVRERPDLASSWAVRAYTLSRQGAKAGAAEAYRQAIALDASDPVTRNNLGTVLLDLGQTREALEAFRQALALHPFYADARNNLGAALERLGRADEARRAYRVATVIDPRHARAHNNLGSIELRAGDVRAAAASFARAASLAPDFDAPALNLAMLDEGAGGAAGLARLEEAAGRPGASPALRARALAARAGREADGRRWESAHGLYRQALQLVPHDPALLNNMAVVEDQLGLDREAVLHLTEALDLDPGMRVAQNNIGIVHVHRGQMDLARSVFEALVSQDPNFHRAHYNLGVIHASEGRVEEARRAFREASRLAPGDAEVRYNLAILARRERGDVAAEMRAYEDVLRLDPNLVEAHLALGSLLADPATPRPRRDPARARRHLRRFLELAAGNDEEGRAQATDWLAWLDH